MKSFDMSRRRVLAGMAAGLAVTAVLGPTRPANAAPTKLTFLTNWFAQAEHGGFYQALATGLYEKAGLDVTIKMGGPQVNSMQLLTGGDADIIMGYDIQVLKGIENGLPVRAIGAAFQFDPQGVMTHPDVKSLADLKDKKILISSASQATFWPWLKKKFGLSDAQAAPYTFNLQPFLADGKTEVQAYPSSEPFEAKAQGADVNFFLFADAGYPPYGSTILTTEAAIAGKSDALAAFMKASLEGWKSYLSDPAPANALIKRDNPKMTDERIAFSIAQMKTLKLVNGGDAATQGIGVMTEARWKQTYDFLVEAGLLKASTDWKKAFTTQYVKDLHIMIG